ncbi:MAG: helix-turn-helix transcriptional regulator [Flavobacteriales bacterium]|nr:helix-turn-helix transcriptional regulator [Flavobacteriales bacterium]
MVRDKNNPTASFLRERRKASKLTQAQLADLAGVGLRLVRDVEQGKPNLHMEKVDLLLAFFGHRLGPIPLNQAYEP